MKTHRYFQSAAISFALIFANSAPAYCQVPQNNPAPALQIQRVKDQVQKIGMGEDVTVILFSGVEYYGAVSKIELDSFEIAEVDLKQMVSIAYTEVEKVEKGYGYMNSSTGKREKPSIGKGPSSRAFWIVMLAGVGATVGLAIWGFKRLGRQRSASRFPRIP
jgi:hypothetical protein